MMRTVKSLVLAAAVLTMGAMAARAQVATLKIETDKPVAKVSPTLYGLMTEEINYSYDGGLYGELVQDRTFLSRNDPENWIPVPQGTAKGTVTRDMGTGPSGALPTSEKITVDAADAADTFGLRNGGWWGVPVRPNTTYTGSVYAKGDAAGVAAKVRVSLIANDTGKVLAEATLPALTADWKQYSFQMRTGGDAGSTANNQIVASVDHPGTVWLQLLSVFRTDVQGPRERQPR